MQQPECFHDRLVHDRLACRIAIACGAIQKKSNGGSVRHHQRVVLRGRDAFGRDGQQLRIVMNPNLPFFYQQPRIVIDRERLAKELQPVLGQSSCLEVGWAVQRGRKADLANFIRRQPDHDNLIGRRAEDFAPILHTLIGKGRGCDSRVEVQLQPVIRHPIPRAEVQMKISQGLVAGQSSWDRQKICQD